MFGAPEKDNTDFVISGVDHHHPPVPSRAKSTHIYAEPSEPEALSRDHWQKTIRDFYTEQLNCTDQSKYV